MLPIAVADALAVRRADSASSPSRLFAALPGLELPGGFRPSVAREWSGAFLPNA
jgi:hypothetical protein